MKKKSTMRRGQMLAIAALFTSAIAPYAVSADTMGSVTTDAGSSRTLDVVTTSTEVTSADTASTYVEKSVDFIVSTDDNFAETTQTESYYKTNFFGDVSLEIAQDGTKYAHITLVGHASAFTALKDAQGNDIAAIAQSKEGETFSKTFKLALNDKYQASFTGESDRGNTTFNLDLAHEKFDFEFSSALDSYFTAWLPNADVITLKDGKKVAYVTLAGHSYAAEKVYEGSDTSKLATIVHAKGTFGKDLVRVVRLPLDADNKAAVFMPNERMDAAISFDFTEKAAVANFATAADVTKAAALKVEYSAVDPAAGSWHPMAFPSTFTAVKAKAAGEQIHVVYSTTGDVTAVTVKQNGEVINSALKNGELSFTVASLEGLSIEADVNSARGATTYKVNVTKAQVDESVTVADFEVPTVAPAIPTTTDVEGKKATVTFKASSEVLNTYFQKGFFGDVQIVEIDGQSYADLNIIEKSIGLEYNYIMPNGTIADVAEISGNRATQNGEYAGFSAVIRIPVAVDENGAFTFTLDTFGGQPGTDSEAAYQFTFTGKIQNNVALPFTDVKNEATKQYVQQLANWGALNLNNTKFNPGNDLTRAQFSLMIARALNLKPTKATAFKDVAALKDQETKDAIQALHEAGIVNGTSTTTFSPGNKITRQQAAMMIYRLMTKQLNYTATATVNDLSFNDADEIKSAEAQLAFAELQKAGIMSGSQGFINPQSNLTRGQMAKILVESLKKTGFDQ